MKKRNLIGALVLTLGALTLGGCGGGDTAKPVPETFTPAPTPEQIALTYTYIISASNRVDTCGNTSVIWIKKGWSNHYRIVGDMALNYPNYQLSEEEIPFVEIPFEGLEVNLGCGLYRFSHLTIPVRIAD
jgi:hypothetical protein